MEPGIGRIDDFKNRLYQIKELRNKVSHGRKIEANDVYIFVCNVKFLLKCFKGPG